MSAADVVSQRDGVVPLVGGAGPAGGGRGGRGRVRGLGLPAGGRALRLPARAARRAAAR